MKILCKINGEEKLREVYKVQVALFGGPGILIYNEDRTEEWETHVPTEVGQIRRFIGKSNMKAFVVGYRNKQGQIVLEKTIPYRIWRSYTW